MNFRSIADIKRMDDLKKCELSDVRVKRQFDTLDIRAVKQTLGGKSLLGYSVGNDDKHYLAKQLALAKQCLNVGRLTQAIKLLEELKKEEYHHADLSYMLGESYRRKGRLLSPGNKDLAIQNLYEALRFEKCSEYVWKSLGLYYAQEKMPEKSGPILKKFCSITVVSTDQNKNEEMEQVADQLASMKQYLDSVEIYTLCLKGKEHNSLAHMKRSLCRCMAGQTSVLYLEDLKR